MKTPTERFAQLAVEKKARLLDPAEKEFVLHGYEAASLNRILSTAGMSKGQAYHYISGKPDLYYLVCNRRFLPLLEKAQASFQFDDESRFWPSVEQCCLEVLKLVESDAALSELARGVYDSATGMAALRPLAESANQLLDRIIEDGHRTGAIRTDLPAGLVREMLKGAALSMDRWFARHGQQLAPKQGNIALNGAFEMLGNMVGSTVKD